MLFSIVLYFISFPRFPLAFSSEWQKYLLLRNMIHIPQMSRTNSETFHAFSFRRCRALPQLYFMICLSCHATTHGTKECIRNAVDHACGLIITLAFSAISKNGEKARKYLQAVVASNHANVVGIQTKLVLFTNHIGSGGHSQTRACASFEAHASGRAVVLAHVTGLEKQTSTKISLAALVIRPSRSRIYVIESTMAHEHLSWTVAQHGPQATARFSARNFAHANVKRLAIAGVCG
jgi:hypothetical protein